MIRSNNSKGVTHKSFNEGTAARTRPVNLEEIMSRRKKKLNTDDKEGASEIRKPSEKDDNGVLSDRDLESKDSKHSKKGNSKHVEEAISKEHKHIGSRDNGNHDSDAKTKLKSNDSKSSRDKESKNEKQSHQRSRANNRKGADSEKESEKKQAKVTIKKDKHEKRERKSGKEGKRKLESRVDDKDRSVFDGSFLKKHDSGKLRDAKYSERKDQDCFSERKNQKKENYESYSERKGQKEEHSRTHRDEPKAKRRRSRSREYVRERDRSDSMSPRVQGRSYHGRDYDEPLFQSSTDKSRRKYSDADKYRTSGNGGYGSGHYRKHRSGLGGYSPRKRRNDATGRTPPPMKRSPERKNSTWDQPPAGTSVGGSGSVFTDLQSLSSRTIELISSTAVAPTATKPQPVPSVDATSMPINVPVDSVQLTQATRPRRRLYIENLPSSTSEKSVIDCLNDFLLSSGVNHIQGAKPCISCIINKEKCQAVVEFLTPEDATSAISFDGRSLSGSILKIRRPKDFVDFVDASTGGSEKTGPTVKAISEVVKDSPHKIFIGGISNALSSDMLLEIVGAFGLLRGYHFEFNEELNGPCAFLEYEDHSITQKACAGLNGMKLGGHVLTAVQAFLDSHGEEDDDEDLPSYGIPFHAKSLLADSTQVLQLKNVFNPEEFLLLSHTELEEILEDTRLECTRFGTVKSINVVRFNSKSEVATAGPEQQDPHTDCPKIEPAASSPSGNGMNGDVGVSTLNNVVELQDVRVDTAHTNTSDENPVEDYERKESAKPSPADGVSFELEDHSNLDEGEDDNVEEVALLDVDITEEKTADVKAHSSNGRGKHLVETANSNSSAADDGELGNGNNSNHQMPDLEVFEAGCVLVEFLRKEAACAAAHCLHQRYYDERIVSASYISHELYMTKFSR